VKKKSKKTEPCFYKSTGPKYKFQKDEHKINKNSTKRIRSKPKLFKFEEKKQNSLPIEVT